MLLVWERSEDGAVVLVMNYDQTIEFVDDEDDQSDQDYIYNDVRIAQSHRINQRCIAFCVDICVVFFIM